MNRYLLTASVICAMLGSASLQAEALKLSDAADLIDKAADELKTVEPVECTKALAELASIWVAEKDCLDTFDTLTEYLGGFQLPSIEFDADGDSLSDKFNFDSGIPGPFPEVDLDGICATGQCVSNLAGIYATIDQSCSPEALQKLPPEAAVAMKITRGFVDSVCTENAEGKYCTEEALNTIANISPFVNATDSQAQDVVCSSCSIEIQRDLFAALGADVAMHAYSLAQMYCLKDENGEYCPATDVMEGAAYVLTPPALWKLVFSEEKLCDSSCKTEALALFADSDNHPEQCFEEKKGMSVLFGFSGMKDGLGGVPAEVITSAVKADVSLALNTFVEYVDIDVLEVGEGTIAFAMSLIEEFKGEPSLTEDDASAAIASSPFMNANMVAQNATKNPTKPLQVDQGSGPTDAPVPNPTDAPVADPTDAPGSSLGHLYGSGCGVLVSALGIALGMLNYFTV